MSHGDQNERATKRPHVSSSTVDTSIASGSRSRPDEGTSPTISSPSGFGSSVGIRPYVADIDRLVESFRTGERPRFEVVSSITQFLNADKELSPQERAQSFELYMAEISSIPETPRNKGKQRAEPRISTAGIGEGGLGANVENEGTGAFEGDVSVGGDDSSSSGSESDGPRKKRKLRQSDMPWSGRKGGFPTQNPSCIKTAELIRRFNRDLKSTKLYIKLAPFAPRGIPMSEWEHIFKGEAVDLDKILSSLHRVSFDTERKASVGDTEISIGGVETKRKVETSSEWSMSWRSASKAIAFIYEHREQELAEYGDYIERLFAAKRSTSHGQVILFDKGVRNEVGGGQVILLTDYQYFTSLYAATLQDDGVEYHRGR